MEAVDKESIRLLKVLGNTTSTKVMATAGAEQEYFLIDSKYMESRPDFFLQEELFSVQNLQKDRNGRPLFWFNKTQSC